MAMHPAPRVTQKGYTIISIIDLCVVA